MGCLCTTQEAFPLLRRMRGGGARVRGRTRVPESRYRSAVVVVFAARSFFCFSTIAATSASSCFAS